jgi:hypothetical protein
LIELYAISEHPAPPLPALDDRALSYAPAGDLAVVWAPAPPDAPSAPTLEALRRHEAIVETLMADRDVLPVRFGTRVRDARAAALAIDERRDDLALALRRVRGASEVAVRVAAAPGATSDGARALTVVHRPLSELARATRLRRAPSGELLRAAYLVDRGAVSAFAAAVGAIQAACPDLRVLCTGPWPPYSFASSS